ncbi:pyridoxal 5'-phosphate synthase subunit PDX1 [Ziziphus jujuba]|uniref:Pyridoxal 5'-phosphate synthase subunit PDX1 n=1 Tax=Ziziphus jujuba TaxID=326968 RepID=A0A6P4B5E6_ZIZJJ|nr:pyridoxal 5'-phosphate synthase subunit PDX1 [Ziziphus jujuba]
MAATTKSKNIIMAPIKDMVSKNDNTRILNGGTVVEVTNSKQAKHAEQAGACAVLVIDPISYSSSSKNYMITASLINNIRIIEKAVLGEALKRVSEGATLIKIQDGILMFKSLSGSKEYCASDIVTDKIKTLPIDHNGMALGYSEPPLELPLAQFVGGGGGGGGSIRSPADGVKMMSVGFDGVFLDPKNLPWFGRDKHVKNIIDAVRHHDRKGDI